MKPTSLLIVAALSVWASVAIAKGGSSGSASRGSSSVGSRASTAAASRSTGGIRSSQPGMSKFRDNLASRRSLIGGPGPQPSTKLAEEIQHRESSGPGWIGTAVLISLLSRHDLSSSDRSWIQGQIDSRNKDDDDGSGTLLPAVHPKVALKFTGLDKAFHPGEPATISIDAHDDAGKGVVPACSFSAHAATSIVDGKTVIQWTPQHAGVELVSCGSGGHEQRRLIRVIVSEPIKETKNGS